ncbi:MAG TPA: hypothetical protein VHO46_12630 [Bacteroidales bacterium]|nr:hypothetical protein [Bacteroidales bacterium]
MTDLLVKLNYKRQDRIAVINAEESFSNYLSGKLNDVIIDKKIDPRYPYSFMILFVSGVTEVAHLTPIALHNLTADGVLWFCYPKKGSKRQKTTIDRDHGWKALNDAGFRGVRMISIDENWSALRFRNVKYIKSLRSAPKSN